MPESPLSDGNLPELLLIFSATLLVAVLVCHAIKRSLLSMVLLFLAVGILTSLFFPQFIPGDDSRLVLTIAELALFWMLFTDGMNFGFGELKSTWQLPGRALLFGLPLMFALTAVLAHFLLGIPWIEALLIGAVLSPTDPAMAEAIAGSREVPSRLRRLLNVENGLSDGLALALVTIFLSLLSRQAETSLTDIVVKIGSGILLGLAFPWAAVQIGKLKVFSLSGRYEPFYAFSIGMVILSLSKILQADSYLAAFIGGAVVTSFNQEVRDDYKHFGELFTQLLKLFSLFLFGALLVPSSLFELPLLVYFFALMVIVVVRPVSISLALTGSRISIPEWVAAAWFGPRGFASIVFALLVLEAGFDGAARFFHIVVVVIVGSILLHSTTDMPIAKWFSAHEKEPAENTHEN